MKGRLSVHWSCLFPRINRIIIQPQAGKLEYVKARVPTPLGAVSVEIENPERGSFRVKVDIPEKASARVVMPLCGHDSTKIELDGVIREGKLTSCGMVFEIDSGTHQCSRKKIS